MKTINSEGETKNLDHIVDGITFESAACSINGVGCQAKTTNIVVNFLNGNIYGLNLKQDDKDVAHR